MLGSLLVDGKSFARVSQIIVPESFYRDRHRLIFGAMLSIFKAGGAIDMVTVSQELQSRGKLDDAGGVVYLAELARSTVSSANVEHYARIVKRYELQRAAIRLLYDEIQKLEHEDPEPTEVLDRVVSAAIGISRQSDRRKTVSIGDTLHDATQSLEASVSRGGISGLKTGYYDVDRITGGLQDGDYIVLAARPSVGKTALALNMARFVAGSGVAVGFFSLEMQADKLASRLLLGEARVTVDELRRDDRLWSKIADAASRIQDLPIYVHDESDMRVHQIMAKAKELITAYDIGLIVIDYLQLIRWPRATNEQEAITMISRGVKAMAKDLNVPVLVLSQLSREIERRKDKEPRLSDLRASGSIEQDADVVMFLQREPAVESRTVVADVIVAKNRNGPVGRATLLFDGPTMSFSNYDSVHEEVPF